MCYIVSCGSNPISKVPEIGCINGLRDGEGKNGGVSRPGRNSEVTIDAATAAVCLHRKAERADDGS